MARQVPWSGFDARSARTFSPGIQHFGRLRLLRAAPSDDRREQLVCVPFDLGDLTV
jgi:hypothetical protein